MTFRPQVFVAMSFEPSYETRFKNVIVPAIENVVFEENRSKAFRVDTSKSGESILTEIMDGIAHSLIILADVSTVGKDSKTGRPYRNGNVGSVIRQRED